MSTDALENLHTALLDTRKGYDEAIADAEAPDLKAVFKEVQALHAQAHVDVHHMLEQRGVEPDEAGSLMAKVHETVIGIRSALVGLDAGSLGSFASGEKQTLAKYDAAIEEAAADRDAATVLEHHRSELAAMVERMNGS